MRGGGKRVERMKGSLGGARSILFKYLVLDKG
jgi:hypothetical protein